MTKREYFDLLVTTSAAGLFSAVGRSTEGGGVSCCYRTGDGRKCAGGLLIPDEVYDRDMEGMSMPLVIKGWGLDGLVPEGMTPGDLFVVQLEHDKRAARSVRWDHEGFVAGLLNISCFREFAGEGVVAG